LGWRLSFLDYKWREACFGYPDNVQVLGINLQDIVKVNPVCRDLKAASGALISRNRPLFLGWPAGLASAVASDL
jgi:hypothetical protein